MFHQKYFLRQQVSEKKIFEETFEKYFIKHISSRLPGEAMQIDRVMDAFAAHYCEQNPDIFEERDTCFILSFSIIMLNTALHNPNAKMKISDEQFIKQNKGMNSGKDFPPDMLEAIFRSIKEEPFKIPDETYDDLMYTFFSPEREGWLLKQVRTDVKTISCSKRGAE